MSFTILIIEDEEHARENIRDFLDAKGFNTIEAETLKKAREQIDLGNADIILLDAMLPDGHGPVLIEETAHISPRPPIIVITGHGDIDMAVKAMKNGAHDFLQKPIQFDELEKSIIQAIDILKIRRELAHLRQKQLDSHHFILGESKEMKTVYHQAERAAQASVSVLITGKTGTGKEVLARAIHQMGNRSDKPFIDLNCAAIQSTMVESELFGYEAGAFTSAEKRKPGLMEIADGGILFLDEISTMHPEMQAKLLRALEDRSFRRMGGTKLIKVDVQIIAASNQNLLEKIKNGEFREDLYYRLKVVDLHLPTLKERKEDIPELIGYFIKDFNPKMGLNILEVNQNALQKMINYEWPGNIRELKNTIERAMIFCDEATIGLEHLPPEINKTP